MVEKSERNMMVGGSPHVREVGLHVHQWSEVGRVATGQPAAEVYEVCAVCGARRIASGMIPRATQAGWIAGGEWQGDGLHDRPMQVMPAVGMPAPPSDDWRDAARGPNVTRGGEPVRKAPVEEPRAGTEERKADAGRKGGER